MPFQLELKPLGQTIRAFRTRAGLSQEHLAQKAGLDRSLVAGIERGERNVGIRTLRRLRDALDLSWVQLGRELDRRDRPRGR